MGKLLKIGSRRTLFREKLLSLKKNEKCYFIFYNKNRNTYQFHVFTIKNDFRNMLESGKFSFENNLKLFNPFYDHQILCIA